MSLILTFSSYGNAKNECKKPHCIITIVHAWAECYESIIIGGHSTVGVRSQLDSIQFPVIVDAHLKQVSHECATDIYVMLWLLELLCL